MVLQMQNLSFQETHGHPVSRVNFPLEERSLHGKIYICGQSRQDYRLNIKRDLSLQEMAFCKLPNLFISIFRTKNIQAIDCRTRNFLSKYRYPEMLCWHEKGRSMMTLPFNSDIPFWRYSGVFLNPYFNKTYASIKTHFGHIAEEQPYPVDNWIFICPYRIFSPLR